MSGRKKTKQGADCHHVNQDNADDPPRLVAEWNHVATNQFLGTRSIDDPPMRTGWAHQVVLLVKNPTEQMVEVAVPILETQDKILLALAAFAKVALKNVEAEGALPSPD
jgi:hypothetical protein